MEEKFLTMKKVLEKCNQEHILESYNRLNEEKKKILLEQVLSIDFEEMDNLYNKTKEQVDFQNIELKPIEYIDKEKLEKENIDYEKYYKLGQTAIKEGKLAVVTMAGGQGTRLGHNGPKGTYILGEKTNKSIFEILCDTLKKAEEKFETYVRWYIMTSNENNKDTIAFFENNNYFGYPKDKIKFFIQDELPMIDLDGKLLLNEEGLLRLAANGHGGIFESMFKSKIIDDMKNNNIEWLFIGGVDNVLVKMIDPILIGLSIEKTVLAAGKSIIKGYPEEKVGVFCKKNGKPSVIEYTEISKELANKKTENGDLLYAESHILCNMFHIKALEKISKNKLPYHPANKKSPYMNSKGEIIIPDNLNAYKFEAFLFDAFELLDDMLILRVKREDEFAPVKNKEGVDSPETARKLYNNFFQTNI